MMVNVLEWLIPASFALVGLGLLMKGMIDLRNARQALQWPTAPGVITKSEIKITSDSDGDNYAPDIEYTYTVAGREYRSHSIWAGSRIAATRKFAENVTARYPMGQTVTVTYHPVKSETAVLEPGKTKFAWIYVGGGGLFLLLAVALMVVFTIGK